MQAKLKEGTPSEASLADQLKAFDALLAKHKDEKTDDVAQILYMKAMLYLQVLEDDTKGEALIQQLKTDFPETRPGKDADRILEKIKRQAEARKVQRSLVAGAKFPDFEERDLEGRPLLIANYKSKVVLIDFWATWCGPCVAELPNVLKTYEKHHAQGFEIIGISLDQDEAKLEEVHRGQANALEAVLRWQRVGQQARCEVRREQHPGDLPAGRRRQDHRQESAR